MKSQTPTCSRLSAVNGVLPAGSTLGAAGPSRAKACELFCFLNGFTDFSSFTCYLLSFATSLAEHGLSLPSGFGR